MELEKYLEDHPKEFLIFDFDHTIATLILPWSKLTEQLKYFEKNVDKSFTSKVKMVNDISVVANMIVKRFGPPSWVIIAKLWIDFERKNLKGYTPNKEIIDFIRKNKDKYTFYLWTSNTLTTVDKILGEQNIRSAFSKLVTRDSVKYLKPDPVGFKDLYREDEDKSKYLMIGDSRLNDGVAADKCGIDFLQI